VKRHAGGHGDGAEPEKRGMGSLAARKNCCGHYRPVKFVKRFCCRIEKIRSTDAASKRASEQSVKSAAVCAGASV
jgi:hypothetical protein